MSEGEDDTSESESDIQRAYAELYSESFKTKKHSKGLVLKITCLEEDLRKAREREFSTCTALRERESTCVENENLFREREYSRERERGLDQASV